MKVRVHTKPDGGIYSIFPVNMTAGGDAELKAALTSPENVADDTSGEEIALREEESIVGELESQEVEIPDNVMDSGNVEEIIKEVKRKLK